MVNTTTKRMPSGWRTSSIGELADKIGMGPFGSNIRVETFVSDGIPVVSGVHLNGIHLNDNQYNYLSLEHADRLKSSNVYRGDVIFTHAGNIGQVALIPDYSKYERYVLSQRQFFLRCNKEKLLPEFIVYYFKSREGQHKLLANRNQTGVPSLAQPVTYLKSIPIVFPQDIEEQRAIAAVLSSLDDKIELLREQNNTLESIAQILFKHWFVDFEFPDSQGKPYKSSGGEMIDSELGRIPAGWRAGRFTDVVDVLSGGTPQTGIEEYWNGSIPFFTPKDAKEDCYVMKTEKHITQNGFKNCNSRLYPRDTVFITARGTVGKCVLSACDMAMNQSCYALVGKEVSNLFVFLQTQSLIKRLQKVADGGVFDAITVSTFESTQVICADEKVIQNFENSIQPIFKKILNNSFQIQTLSNLRDALLPRLMRGEVRVKLK